MVSADVQALLSLTQQMLDQAKAGEWEALVESESQRQSLLEPCAQALSVSTDRQADADTMREIQALNDQLTRLTAGGRENVAASINRISAGSSATKAYTDISR